MIKLYFTNINSPDSGEVFKKLLDKADLPTREKILSYQSRSGQLARLCGKFLLNKLVPDSKKTERPIDHIKYDQWGKPFISSDFDFNISHSGNIVICGGVTDAKIGVDIEKEEARDISGMQEYFTTKEWSTISGTGIVTPFYKMWVRKEACLKAAGKGFLRPLHEIDVCDDEVVLDNSKWFLHDLLIRDGYAACVATNKQNENISVEEVDINTLVNE